MVHCVVLIGRCTATEWVSSPKHLAGNVTHNAKTDPPITDSSISIFLAYNIPKKYCKPFVALVVCLDYFWISVFMSFFIS